MWRRVIGLQVVCVTGFGMSWQDKSSQDWLQLLQYLREADLPFLIHRNVFLHADCADLELGHDHRVILALHIVNQYGGQRSDWVVHG